MPPSYTNDPSVPQRNPDYELVQERPIPDSGDYAEKLETGGTYSVVRPFERPPEDILSQRAKDYSDRYGFMEKFYAKIGGNPALIDPDEVILQAETKMQKQVYDHFSQTNRDVPPWYRKETMTPDQAAAWNTTWNRYLGLVKHRVTTDKKKKEALVAEAGTRFDKEKAELDAALTKVQARSTALRTAQSKVLQAERTGLSGLEVESPDPLNPKRPKVKRAWTDGDPIPDYMLKEFNAQRRLAGLPGYGKPVVEQTEAGPRYTYNTENVVQGSARPGSGVITTPTGQATSGAAPTMKIDVAKKAVRELLASGSSDQEIITGLSAIRFSVSPSEYGLIQKEIDAFAKEAAQNEGKSKAPGKAPEKAPGKELPPRPPLKMETNLGEGLGAATRAGVEAVKGLAKIPGATIDYMGDVRDVVTSDIPDAVRWALAKAAEGQKSTREYVVKGQK